MADKIDFVTASYVLGILSIVFAFVSPFAGLIIGIIGISQSRKHGSERAKRLSLIGIILSIIFIVLSVFLLYYSVSSGLTDLLPSV